MIFTVCPTFQTVIFFTTFTSVITKHFCWPIILLRSIVWFVAWQARFNGFWSRLFTPGREKVCTKNNLHRTAVTWVIAKHFCWPHIVEKHCVIRCVTKPINSFWSRLFTAGRERVYTKNDLHRNPLLSVFLVGLYYQITIRFVCQLQIYCL